MLVDSDGTKFHQSETLGNRLAVFQKWYIPSFYKFARPLWTETLKGSYMLYASKILL